MRYGVNLILQAIPPVDNMELLQKGYRIQSLDQQAMDLAKSTVYTYDSVCRLQKGLMEKDSMEPGCPLSESETLKVVPSLLQLDMVSGGKIRVGRMMRMIKADADHV